MSDGGFEVVHTTLDDHASALDGLTERLRGAVDAGRQVTMSDDAYGIICRPFAWLIKPLENRGVDTLQGAADAMDSVAEGMRATSQVYRDVEDGNSALFRGEG